MLLREYLEQGWSQEALSEKLGMNRRTIHRWVKSGQLDRELDGQEVRYAPRPTVARKLDEYRPLIEQRLREYPLLSAVRLYQEARAAGYRGHYTQLKEYVRTVRPVEKEPVVRFETPAGMQAQVDFAHFRLPWGQRWALVVVLAFSRLLWVRFFPRQDMRTLFSGLEQAFAYFGGITTELLFDQMRAVALADHRPEGGPLIENVEFLRFAAHWQFRPRVCRAYRAKTKGKVERPIRYLRDNFFYGRTFLNDADLEAQLGTWIEEVANCRVHGTTGELPRERFEREERSLLTPLAARPYRSLAILPPQAATRSAAAARVEVQRRSLSVYGELAGGQG